MVSVLALNVANPTDQRARELLEWLWHTDDEVLVLSEVGAGAGSGLLRQVCVAAGHQVVATTGGGRSALGVLIVGRGMALDPRLAPTSPQVAARVALAGVAGMSLAGVYGAASDPVRYTSRVQRQRKRDWLSACDDWLDEWVTPESILIGDLNLVDPQHDSRLPHVLPEETATYHALTDRHRLVDAYRAAHPSDTDPSWVDHSGAGCRYDHAFVGAGVRGTADLVHEPRTLGLSDHSAIRLTAELANG